MNRRRGRICGLVITGALIMAAPPGVAASGAVALGAISGKVIAAAGGAGLGRVDIQVLDGHGTIVADGQSAADGSYAVSGLAASATGYVVCAFGGYRPGDGSPAGYATRCYKNVAWDSFGNPRGATLAPVAAGVTTTGISFALPELGGISGRVTDAVSGASLSGIVVIADDGFHDTHETTTGSDGSYLLPVLAPSTTGYTVCFIGAFVRGALARKAVPNSSTRRHDNKCYKNVPYHVTDGYPLGTTRVKVAQGVVTKGIDGVLELQGGISGRVRTARGAGISGLPITVFDSAGFSQFTLPLDNSTGPDGSYLVDGLDPSTTGYSVCFGGGGVYPDQCYRNATWGNPLQPAPGSTRVPVKAGATTTGVDSVWAAPGGISGRVTDAAGRGLSRVQVVVTETGGFTQTSYTSASGSYLVTALAASKVASVCFVAGSDTAAGGIVAKTGYASECYRDLPFSGFDFRPPGITPVPVSAGAVTTGINAALGLDGAISGSVTSAAGGHPLTVDVSVYDSAGRGVGSTQTSNGHYLVPGLGASRTGYRVCFNTISYLAAGGTSTTGYAPQCYRNASYSLVDLGKPGAGSTPVPVAAGRTSSGINVAMHTGGVISGTVTAADGGERLFNVGVVVFDSSGAEVQSGGTDGSGNYAFTGLAASATGYTLCFKAAIDFSNPSPTGYQPKCYQNTAWNGGPAPAPGATRVPVTFGQTVTGIDMKLPDAATISGTVAADPAGTSVFGVDVVVFDSVGHRVASARTGDNGTYTVSGLGPAKSGYRVCFDSSAATTHYAGQCYRNIPWKSSQCPPPGTTRVPAVMGRATTGIDAILRK